MAPTPSTAANPIAHATASADAPPLTPATPPVVSAECPALVAGVEVLAEDVAWPAVECADERSICLGTGVVGGVAAAVAAACGCADAAEYEDMSTTGLVWAAAVAACPGAVAAA